MMEESVKQCVASEIEPLQSTGFSSSTHLKIGAGVRLLQFLWPRHFLFSEMSSRCPDNLRNLQNHCIAV